MRWLALTSVLVLQGFGCAAEAALSYCSPAELEVAPASARCRHDPQAQRREAELAEVIVPSAGFSRIHVHFDEHAAVALVCAERGNNTKQWSDLLRVGKQLDPIRATPARPACLAGSRLEFNRRGAQLGEVDWLITDCERRANTPGVSFMEKNVRDCFERNQRERGELWVFDPDYRLPFVFESSAGSAERHDAIHRCASRDVEVGRPDRIETQASAYVKPKVIECLGSHGWQLSAAPKRSSPGAAAEE